MGTSTRPVCLTFADHGEHLGALRSLGADARVGGGALPLNMMGMDASVSTLLSTVGWSNSPRCTLRMYFARGSPTRPSMEAMSAVDSPADERPAAAHDRQMKLVRGAENALAENTRLHGVVDGVLDMVARERVLVADVEDPLLGADGEAPR